jgi:hypothetical protein
MQDGYRQRLDDVVVARVPDGEAARLSGLVTGVRAQLEGTRR